MILSGHPWIYRDALAPCSLAPGEPVDVIDRRGRVIARGLAEAGPIAVRVFSTGPQERFDQELLCRRVRMAFALRGQALPPDTTAYRLLHGEGDRLPGVVCDRYGEFAVLKLDGEAAAARRDDFVHALREPLRELGVRGLLGRYSRKQQSGVTPIEGDQPPDEVEVSECGMKLLVNLWSGQKTGLFLDHRASRARVRGLARGLDVLNLYGYTGGFSVAAGLGGAKSVTTVDIAQPAVDLAQRTFVHNQLASALHRVVARDVPDFLRDAVQAGERYDLIVCDPPNFAPNEASLERALDSYVQLHAASLALLAPGGLYLAASCSSHVRADAFVETLRGGARRARRVLSVLEQSGAPFDHPRLLAFPEGDYLKVALCRVSD